MDSGNLEITTGNFRYVHKLCHVFDVEWMLTKCTDFYQELIETPSEVPTRNSIEFLFGEATYLCEAGRSSNLLKIWISKMAERDEMECRKYIRIQELPEFQHCN